MHDALTALVTGRTASMFARDVAERHVEIAHSLSGKRVLVIGGAGSIGGATVRAMLPFSPSCLHVVDHSENNLVELVRDLRSALDGLKAADFRALPLDFGSVAMQRLLREQPGYDFVLNFAALKHVRSEKDIYSVMQMLDTNVLKCVRLLRWLNERSQPFRYFCVSTDKAANPVNLMGASKRLMEHVVFSGEAVRLPRAEITSARFANVAFSDGSLLHGFLLRLQKRQPFAAPRATRRYFISLREAGEICLLAAVCTPHRHLLIPRLDPGADLVLLEEIAATVLRHHGFEPRYYSSSKLARSSLPGDTATGMYPLVLTELDTTGEKPYEEFIGTGEQALDIGMEKLLAIPYQPTTPDLIAQLVSRVEVALSADPASLQKQDIATWIADAIPQFRHTETGQSLDDRM